MNRARRGAYIWFAVSALILIAVVVGFPYVKINKLDQFFAAGYSMAGIAYVVGCMSLARSKGRFELLGLVGLLFPFGLLYLVLMKDRTRYAAGGPA